MQKLVRLNLANCKIKSMNIFCNEENFPNLKWLDIQNNKMADLPPFKLSKLEYLDISHNKIEKINDGWTGHPNVRVVKSVDNKFKSLAPFRNMPNLEELYMASNVVTALNGWESLPKLKRLHLRKNKIASVSEEEGDPELPALVYLNLRSNKIATVDMMLKLLKFPLLDDLNVIKNPVESGATSFQVLLATALIRTTSLKRFCKCKVEESNKLEAIYLAHYKHEKEVTEAKRLAEEERLKAEGEKDD